MTINPYAAPQSESFADAVESRPPVDRDTRARRITGGYFGTVCAGCVFGLIGGPVGVGIGLVMSGVIGLLWFVLASRVNHRTSPLVLTGISGALTGFSSVALLIGMFLHPGPIDSVSLVGIVGSGASAIGGVGGVVGAVLASISSKQT